MKRNIDSLKELSFHQYSSLALDDSGAVLPIESKPNKKNVIYALVIDGVVSYIGKTNNLRKRINYYRTSINRKDSHSDSNKSNHLICSLEKGQTVEIWFRQCFIIPVKQDIGVLNISTMDIEEPHIIGIFKPIMNKHYVGRS